VDCFIFFVAGLFISECHEKSHVLQHTYPAIERVMEHLHLMALNKFKSYLEESLRNTEGFAESVRQCSQASMEEFDAGIRGMGTTTTAPLFSSTINVY
jgi:hypothetical protein